MFRWFESRLDPFPADPPAQPPRSLYAFCRHYTRGSEAWLVLMALTTAGIALAELAMYAYLGALVDRTAAEFGSNLQAFGSYLQDGERILVTMPDGGSFSARRVVARQSVGAIFNLAASFHVGEDAADVQTFEELRAASRGGMSDYSGVTYQRIEENFGVVARWTLTIAIPMLVVMLGLRREVLLVFHPSFTDDASFMILLAVQPLIGCWIGLAGNIVVMTGHSRWNLFNSLLVGASNAALNALWIPRYGLWGAALATAVAAVSISLLDHVLARVVLLPGAVLWLWSVPPEERMAESTTEPING